MNLEKQRLWERFEKYYFEFPSIHLCTDLSRMQFDDGFFDRMSPRIARAFADMEALEAGQIANPDENRMVGHYWLRNPSLAPSSAIRSEIETALAKIKSFSEAVHTGKIQGQSGRFKNLLLIGIGGSSLGPQFVSHALGHPKTDRMKSYFFDNTDSDGMERVLATIGDELGATLCVVVSKSGGTKETRNGMLEAASAYAVKGLVFEKHAVAITRNSSDLHLQAKSRGWLDVIPMWDWVGGRTSELSAVGLLPASLQGFDIEAMLLGAKACDEVTRTKQIKSNPAAQLALMWFHAGGGTGRKNMVVLPYRDRLELFSRYLQQLTMESLGKALDLEGHKVEQGLTVLGNKGSTDQHSYIQQLVNGLNDSFTIFIEAQRGSNPFQTEVESSLCSDDYLSGFLLGTRQALTDNGRESFTLTIREVSAFSIGVLIALFERAVGFYASLINVNAYHQPGVEAGKKAAESVLQIQTRILSLLPGSADRSLTVAEIARLIGSEDEIEHVFKVCQRLVANRVIVAQSGESGTPATRHFWNRPISSTI